MFISEIVRNVSTELKREDTLIALKSKAVPTTEITHILNVASNDFDLQWPLKIRCFCKAKFAQKNQYNYFFYSRPKSNIRKGMFSWKII